MNLLNQWIIIIITLIVAIPIHELGHYYAFRKLGKKPKVKFLYGYKWRDLTLKFVIGSKKDYEGLTIIELMKVYTYGIFAGLLVVVSSMLFFGSFLIIALIMYFLGCKADLLSLYDISIHHQKELIKEKK